MWTFLGPQTPAPKNRRDARAGRRRGGFWAPWSPPAAQAHRRPRSLPPPAPLLEALTPCSESALSSGGRQVLVALAPGRVPLTPPSAPGGIGGGAASGGASGLELTRPPPRRPGSGYLRRRRPGGSGGGSRAGRGRGWTLPSSRGHAWTEEDGAEKGVEGSRRVGGRRISPSWVWQCRGTGVR